MKTHQKLLPLTKTTDVTGEAVVFSEFFSLRRRLFDNRPIVLLSLLLMIWMGGFVELVVVVGVVDVVDVVEVVGTGCIADEYK